MLGVQGHLASNSFPIIMKFLVFKIILQLLTKVWRKGHLHTHTEGNLAILYELFFFFFFVKQNAPEGLLKQIMPYHYNRILLNLFNIIPFLNLKAIIMMQTCQKDTKTSLKGLLLFKSVTTSGSK